MASSKSDTIVGWKITIWTVFKNAGVLIEKFATASIMAFATVAAARFPAPEEKHTPLSF